MNPLHLSQDRNTHDMENSLKPTVQQMAFEPTVNKTIKTRWRGGGGADFNLWIGFELMCH